MLFLSLVWLCCVNENCVMFEHNIIDRAGAPRFFAIEFWAAGPGVAGSQSLSIRFSVSLYASTARQICRIMSILCSDGERGRVALVVPLPS